MNNSTTNVACPHCGLQPGTFAGTPDCQQWWGGSPEAKPLFPGCILAGECVTTSKFQEAKILVGIAAEWCEEEAMVAPHTVSGTWKHRAKRLHEWLAALKPTDAGERGKG